MRRLAAGLFTSLLALAVSCNADDTRVSKRSLHKQPAKAQDAGGGDASQDDEGRPSVEVVSADGLLSAATAKGFGKYINGANQQAVALSGKCSEDGADVVVAAGGKTLATAVCQGGAWQTKIDASAMADGPVGLTVTSAKGSATSSLTLALEKDVVPPTAALGALGRFGITSHLSVSWTASADAASFDLRIASDAACGQSVLDAFGLKTVSHEFAPVPDGALFACLWVMDAAGNRVPASGSPAAFTLDALPATAFRIELPPRPVVGSHIPVAWTAVDDADHFVLRVGKAADCADKLVEVADATGTAAEVASLDSGVYHVCMTAIDAAGNTMAASNNGAELSILPLVLGQPDFKTQLSQHTSVSSPSKVIAVGTKLIVADIHRVLIWNNEPASPATEPDVVIGQPSLDTWTELPVAANTLAFARGLCSDGERLAVTDSSAHRVLIWNKIPTSNFQPADIILGQTDGVSSQPNGGGTVSAASLYAPADCAFGGGALYVSDNGNNRILIWTSVPTATHQMADRVLGQQNFTSNLRNEGETNAPSARRVGTPLGLAFRDGRLYAVDYYDHRVLVWNTPPSTSYAAASLVIGQVSFTDKDPNGANQVRSLGTLYQPSDVTTDGTRLYIADTGNSRVLIFDALPTVNGAEAQLALGQTSGTTASVSCSPPNDHCLSIPTGVAVTSNRLYVTDFPSRRFMAWGTRPASGTEPALLIWGRDAQGRLAVRADNFDTPAGVGSDGTAVAVADSQNHRVLFWKTFPMHPGQAPDVVLGQPDFTSNVPGNGAAAAHGFYYPYGAAINAGRLYVLDKLNNRVLVWKTLPTVNNQAPDFAIGQPDLTSTALQSPPTGASLAFPTAISFAGGKMLIADAGNRRILIYNRIPDGFGATANVAVGQPNLSTNAADGTVSATKISNPVGVLIADGKLVVCDVASRVLIWSQVPTASGAPANVVLGQESMTTSEQNHGGLSASSLFGPLSMAYDGTNLYVADGGQNARILIWKGIPTANFTPADHVFGQPSPTASVVNNGGLGLRAIGGASYVSVAGDLVFVTDSGNNRVLVFPSGAL